MILLFYDIFESVIVLGFELGILFDVIIGISFIMIWVMIWDKQCIGRVIVKVKEQVVGYEKWIVFNLVEYFEELVVEKFKY